MLYGLTNYEDLFMNDDELDYIKDHTDSLLLSDFQEWLTESMAGANQYDYRNTLLELLVKRIQDSGHNDKEAFAALGETLYQWAEQQAEQDTISSMPNA